MPTIDGTPDNNTLNGSGSDDTINGYGGDDQLYGNAGRDVLNGGDGNDQLFGGDGQDTLAGGDGDDTLDGGANTYSTEFDMADYRTAPGLVVVDLAQGRSYGFAGDDVLVNIEGALGGAYNDSLVGSYNREMFSGGQGNDTIDGGGDFDIVNYSYGATAGVVVDLVHERASGGEGNDTLYNIEGVIGTRYDDTLTGNDADNFLRGNAGNDSLVGGAGYDRAAYDSASGAVQVSLVTGRSAGTDGVDTLVGIENLRGSNSADELTGDEGANDIQGRGGNDTIYGLGGADYLQGEDGNDSIEGGDGQDTLRGGAGDDTLDGGIQSQSNPTEHDYADYRDATGGVQVDLGAGTASGSGVGSDTLRNIEGVLGSAYDDSLVGSTESNLFNPGAGNDRADGGDGYDYVGYWDATGGVQVNLATGVVTGAAGNDTLVSIEGVLGSAYGDTLVGGDGDTFIRGYAGNDYLDGAAGIDRAAYDRASGSVWVSLSTGTSSGADGNDTLVGIENLRGSAYNDTLIGDGGANDLQGRGGNDYLDGGAGADSLQGEDGEDTLHGGAGDDTLVGGANVAGQEFDYADYRDAGSAVVVNLVAHSATGGGGNDSLDGIEGVLGSAYNDTITGADSADLFAGGQGDDVIDGGAGFDIVHYRFLGSAMSGVSVNLATGVVGGGDGNDRLTSIEGVIGSDFADTLSGSDAGNFFRGNGGNDVIDGGAGTDRAAYDRATGAVDVSLTRGNSLGADGVDTLLNIENLRGSAYGDRLEGDAGNNEIQGRAGNDLILGQGGNDTLYGEAGDDTLVGGEGDDSLVGGDGSDQLEGGAGNDTLDGGGGTEASVDDVAVYLRAAGPVSVNLAAGTATGEGSDTLHNINHVVGSAGNDTLVGDANDNGVAGYLGDDVLDGGAGRDTLYFGDLELEPGTPMAMASAGVTVDLAAGRTSGGAGNDTISGFEHVVGSRYDDRLFGSAGDETLEGGAGDDLFEGGAGDDVIDGTGDDFGDAASDEDTVLYVHAAAAVEADLGFGRAIGGAGTDVLRNIDNVAGSAFDDSLRGSDGDNVIAGWKGNDQMDGGDGFDRLYYGDIDGLVDATLGVSVNLATGSASGAAGNDTFMNFEGVIGSAGNDTLTGDDAGNQLEGGLGNDALAGAGGNDTLVGDVDDTGVTGGGNDTLLGGAGDDWLNGGAGVDSLDGGDGWDVAFFENGPQGVRVNLRTGVVGNDGFGNAETIANVENVHGGAGNDEIQLGDVGGNYAFGRGGNDRMTAGDAGSMVYAGSGADTIVGGAGSDTVSYWDDGYDGDARSTSGVTVDLAAGTAIDNWGDRDVLSGVENVQGSSKNDRIAGDAGDNRLEGGDGQDTLTGGLGNDTLDGGNNGSGEFDFADYRAASGAVQVNLATYSATGAAGNDTLWNIEGALGSAFDDSLVGSWTSDAFLGGLGNDTIDGGAGFDYVNYTLLDTATAAVQVNLATGVVTGGDGNDVLISIEGVTGSKFNDLLVGSDASNFFRGGLGDDTIVGAAGVDRAAYDRASARVVVSLVSNTASGGDGNDLLSGIEDLTGSAYDDELTGSDVANDIQGRAGNDSIVGLAGADYLQGEDGNDTLRGGDQQDTLRGGAGDDLLDGGAQTLNFEFDFADYRDASGGIKADLAAGVVTGAGVGTDTLVNIEGILGSQYDDTLLGSSGRDFFIPGAGDDSIVGGNDFDFVYYRDASGSVQINLAGGLVTGAAGNDTLVGIEGAMGSGFGDVIIGDGNDNFLRGYAGDDTIDGGAGNDRAAYDFGTGAVWVSLQTNESTGSEGHDTLINIENLRGGAYNDTLIGNDGANDIQGRDGNDYIDGSGGNDYLQGEGGEDTLRGGAGDDTLDGGDNVAGQQFDYADYRNAGGAVVVNLASQQATGAAGTDRLIGIEGALGSAYDDSITGAATADLFAGGQGNDTIDGGDGFDIIHYRFGSATAAVQVNLATGVVTGGDGNDVLISIEGAIGTDFSDALVGSAVDNFLRGNGGDDTLDGAAGNDRAAYDRATGAVNVSLLRGDSSGADGHDTLVNIENLRGSDYADTLEGDGGANDIQARGDNDLVYGLGGNDYLQGEAGNDTLYGGDDQDTLRGGAGDDLLDGGANALNTTFDYADYRDATGSVTVNLATGLASGDGVGTDTLVGIEGALGSAYGDTLIGSTARDLFNPGAGNDSLVGGGDFDIVGYWDAADAVQVNLATGVVTGGSGSDTLVGFNGVLGSSHADLLVGNDNNNFLRGYAGDDTIDGGGGQDRAAYDFGTGAVRVSLVTNESFGSEGHDTLIGIEHLRGGSYNDTLEGNDAANDIEGRAGDDLISGLAGEDSLRGEDGNDTVLGGAGADTVVGGAGDDVLDGGAVLDRVNYSDGNFLDYATSTGGIVLNAATGVVSDGLGGTDQIANFTFYRGSSYDDALTGSTELIFEQFEGGRGDDTIDGGAITDTLNYLNANRAAYHSAESAVSASLRTGTADGTLTGHDTLINISQLRGSAYNDTLEGSDRTDITEVFDGRGGDDTIDGRGGFDEVRYDFGTAGVTVNLALGTATDASGGHDLLSGIEGVRGGSFADVLIGGLAANGTGARDGLEWFIGGGGDDRIDGGGGYDRADYTTSTSGVSVTLGGTGNGTASDGLGGTDTLISIEAVRGSAFDDTLTGSDSGEFESFEGRQGNDRIDGRGGEDRVDYLRSTGAVTVDLAAGTADDGYGGHDTLAHIEDVRGSRDFGDLISGDGSANLIDGQGGNDTLAGAGGNDTLQGQDGDDRLTGGAGNDRLEGGAGHDTAVFSGARADYAIGLTATGVQVVHLAGGEGTDTLVDVESLAFSDGTVGLPSLSIGLAADTGAAGDGLTANGQVQVLGLADGVAWQYTTDAGAHWTDGSGQSFTLAEGSYGASTVQIRLTDATGLGATLAPAVTVDTTAPGTPALATAATLPLGVGQSAQLTLAFDSVVTGLTLSDLVDSKGGSFADLQTSDGGMTWTVTFTPNGDRLGPASIQLSGAYTDLAGNAGAASGSLAIGYAATATASDGYIRNADIYLDVDRSGTVNAGDILKGQTGNDGSLAITLGAGEDAYDLLVRGGTDISTGQAFTGLLKAPAGSTMLSPLTTLLADLLQSGAVSDLATAQARLNAALGLPDGVDLTSYDPLDVVVTQAGTSSAQDKALALDIQAKTLAVANLLDTGAAALQGAAATGATVSTDLASGAVLAALVQQIATAPTVNLTDAGTLSSVLSAAAGDAGLSNLLDAGKQADAVSAASSVLATANQAIESATDAAAAATTTQDMLASLSTAVAVQSVVQGDVANDLAAGNTGSVPTDRGALATLTQAVDVSQLQLTSGQAATADTTAPATPSLALANDNGSSGSDGISTDGTVRVSGLEAGALWEYSTDGGAHWSAGQGQEFLLATGNYAAGTVQVRQADAAGNQSAVGATAGDLTVQAGVTVDLLAYSWKSHTLLSGVVVEGGGHITTTDAVGAGRWDAVTEASLSISAARAVPAGEAAATQQAINLQDAIAILRMVVGLDVNGSGNALSPYQSFAADFNADGSVGLGDAIGVLRQVVGLDAADPQWVLFNEADTSVAARTGLNPGAVPAISLPLNGSDGHLGLVGVLRGDVDGSYAGAAGATDLDTAQPNYLQSLITDKQLDPSQFGIYP